MIYIAGPFFNDRQLAAIMNVEKMLNDLKFDFFSPRLHGVDVKALPEEERRTGAVLAKVFEGNVRNLDNANLLLACIDKDPGQRNADAGTLFELGYYYREALFTGVELFADKTTAPLRCTSALTWSAVGATTNLMIAQAVAGHFESQRGMENFFKHARQVFSGGATSREVWASIIANYPLASAMVEEK